MAINLPGGERDSIHEATAALRTGDAPVKWVEAPKLHVTIQFLGAVEDAKASAIGDALEAAVRDVKPFEVLISGGGAFPDAQRPRVLWIGVEKHPALELLANDVARALAPLGFEPELRPFQPHVTIGRTAKDAAPAAVRDVAEELGTIDYASVVPVESVDLMESMPGRDYRALRRAALGGGA